MLFSILVLLALHAARAASQTCYYPDGVTIGEQDTPCDPSAEASACCPRGGYCLASGLCTHKGIISRASCTDSSWQSNACPRFCMNLNRGGAYMQSCSFRADDLWKCDYGGQCNSDNTLDIRGNDRIVLRPNQSIDIAGEPTNTQGGNSPTSNGSDNRSTSSGSDNTFSAGQMAGVGAGIGGPLLLAAAALGLLLWKEKKKTRQFQGGATAPQMQPDMATEFQNRSAANSAYLSPQQYKPTPSQLYGQDVRSPVEIDGRENPSQPAGSQNNGYSA